MPSSHSPTTLTVAFDDTHAVANAGLILTATLAERLGIEQLVDQLVDLGDRPGAHRPGRNLLTLAQAMAAGGDCIDDADVLRTGATSQVLGHRVMAPSTLGTFLRAFTSGHIRQLDRVAEALLFRAWAAGAGPGDQPITIDVDSTVCEVHGRAKGGAAYGYTKVLGYHPLLATRAETGEVLHLRMRKGSANTARGAERFVNETAGRIRRAGASGPATLRADSGFWSAKVQAACRRHQLRYSITVRHTAPVTAAIAAIDEAGWVDITYPDGGIAQVAETRLPGPAGGRLIVRRTRLVGTQATLWPDWRTTRCHRPARHHRQPGRRPPPPRRGRARHPRPQAGRRAAPLPLRTLPGQRRLGADRHPGPQPAALGRRPRARQQRPGRGQDPPPAAAQHARPADPLPRRRWLHLPAGWPWAEAFTRALARLRAIPLLA